MPQVKAKRGACALSSHPCSPPPSLPSPERAITNTTGKVSPTKVLLYSVFNRQLVSIVGFFRWERTNLLSSRNQSLSRTLKRPVNLSPHICYCPPSCRRTGGVSAGSLLRLAVLPAALPSSAGPLLPPTSAVQTDSARCTRTQTGQLRLHPAPLEKCCYLKKDYMSSFFPLVTFSLLGSLLKVISSFFVLYLFEWDFMCSVECLNVRCFILLTKRIFFLK